MYGSIGTIQLKLGKKKPETDPNICNCNKIEESFQFFHPNVPLGNTCHNNSAMQSRSSLRNLAMYFAYRPLSCINYQTKITTKNKWSIYVNKQTAQSDQTVDILYTLDSYSASLLVKLKPRIFQRLTPFDGRSHLLINA